MAPSTSKFPRQGAMGSRSVRADEFSGESGCFRVVGGRDGAGEGWGGAGSGVE